MTQMLSIVRLALLASALALRAAAVDSAAGHDFFENKIRPLLIEHCLKCHDGGSPDKPKGGLALDTRAGWEKGGEHGSAIIPGQPDKSLLIRALRYTDKDLQMPPKGKQLSASQVALFEEWVRMGAPDPRTGKPAGPPLSNPTVVKNHWAFQPVKEPSVPQIRNPKSEIRNPIDAFILAKLAPKGWTLSPPADPRTLIRRLTFDLHGLPPPMAEVEAFERACQMGNRQSAIGISSTASSPLRVTANAGAATGSTSRATRTRRATSPATSSAASPSATPTATGSSTPSTKTALTINFSPPRSPPTSPSPKPSPKSKVQSPKPPKPTLNSQLSTLKRRAATWPRWASSLWAAAS